MWCPPYDDLKDPNAFRDAVDAAVGRVKLGGPNGPLPPKLQQLVSQFLRVDPTIRPPRCFQFHAPVLAANLLVDVHPGATVTDMCSRPEFDLMRPDKDGCMSMLRLTYDHTPRLEENTVARRKAFTSRSSLKTLSLIHI